jgi:hypothetical protein
MKKSISSSDFYQAFVDYGRASAWSIQGLEALYEFCEESNPDFELDVIMLDCEFCEYGSALEACEGYDFEPDLDDDEDHQEAAALRWLQDRTIVIEFSGGIVLQSF